MKTNSNPLVSIIAPCFNGERYLDQCLESIFHQTYRNWELVIVDDASVDGSYKRIEEKIKISTNKIKFIKLRKNVGVSAARNVGLDNAQGKYMAFIDIDDVWEKEKLSIQIASMEKEKATLSYTRTNILNAEGRVIGKRIYKANLTHRDLGRRNYITLSSAVISRNIIKSKFENIAHEDYIFWLRNKSDKIIGIPKTLTGYRVHSNNLTKSKLKSLLWLWKAYLHISRSIPKSCFLLFRNLLSRI
jgi:glycosyltransferase involved in cell wall biosynthesis